MPPAVALWNYISCGILWRIFFQTGNFAGFSLRTVCIIYIAGRISAAVMAWDIIFLSLAGPVGYYTGNIIQYIKASVVHGPWHPEFEPKEKHFVSGNFAGFSLYISSEGSVKLRWVGRVAHLG